ncbi:endo alpha-1,4 polygalactosaminidase [Thaumasiovibrio sp. DFM-14]|uniref:endo alpha-1,4 polygalactosaminidase n=1 Tax=Thaumasiovibrio sp. DFM-14 TaxID=3384792 RepID=UPI0039A2C0A5
MEFVSKIRQIVILSVLLTISTFSYGQQSIAFYYNKIDSVRELVNYDRVVVSPALINQKQIETLHKAETKVFAYLSVGELDEHPLPNSLLNSSVGENQTWSSWVMDLTAAPWQAHLQQQAQAILAQGFDGLFLDTLDSYQLFTKSNSALQRQEQALITILSSLNQLSPSLIINRGFSVIDKLDFQPDAVVAESLFHGYNADSKSYYTATAQDSQWLENELNTIATSGIEVIVIDYLPHNLRQQQIDAAKQLSEHNYTPYISDGLLQGFGVSTIYPIAKRVLIFYDGTSTRMVKSNCHRLLSMPIEYLGYVPECKSIRAANIEQIEMSRYAAVIYWLSDELYSQIDNFEPWIKKHLNHTPMLFISGLPQASSIRTILGIHSGEVTNTALEQVSGTDWTNNRPPLRLNRFNLYRRDYANSIKTKELIRFEDKQGQPTSLLFKGSWGGAVLNPLPIKNLANNKERWFIDPFRLLTEVLGLAAIPAADATTEAGLRILTSHIDGDGFPSRAAFPNRPYTAEVIQKNILEKYAIPHTVSVIEGEIGATGLFPKQSHQLEAIARSIFRLPNVELASHTYSHPFFWDQSIPDDEKLYGDYLPIPNYKVDYHKEIIGSINYINQRLAPTNKRAEIILWSGAADPTEDVLAIAEEAQLINVNGGTTYVVKGDNDPSQVSPTIAWYPSAVQVYAPVLNENVYTNLWTEHFDGYQFAVESFQLLALPRRLKSISIYYHMYSGTYPASLKGLQRVYDWALDQAVTPLYLSEYAIRAAQLYETGIAKTLNDQWQITTTGVKSIRFPASLGVPVSSDIAGWNKGPDGRYLIITNAKSLIVGSNKIHNKQPRLMSANGQVMRWENHQETISGDIFSHVPTTINIANAAHCRLARSNKPIAAQAVKQTLRLTSESSGLLSVQLRCNKIR